MSAIDVDMASASTTVHVDGEEVLVIPHGPASLTERELVDDPPRPEQLTNSIGAVVDHLDDLVRTRPDVLHLPVRLRGSWATAIAAVELGGTPDLPMALGREAVEDVFRTVATETRADRRRNPGLDPALVDTVVGGCCVAVGIMRRLHLDEITVVP